MMQTKKFVKVKKIDGKIDALLAYIKFLEQDSGYDNFAIEGFEITTFCSRREE